MTSQFKIVDATFESFLISKGAVMMSWSYSDGKYHDSATITTDRADSFGLSREMERVAFYCTKYKCNFTVLYSSDIPVAYRAKPSDGWSPISTGWHKSRLDEYFYERERRLND